MEHRRWGINRRQYPRLNINLTAWYKVINPNSDLYNRETQVKMLDLCQGGMACISDHDIPAHTPVFVKFVLFKVDDEGYVKFHGPLKLAGEVCSNKSAENKQYRLGIAFKEACKDDEGCIAEFVGSTFMMP
jgi:c-di-GMP-binding flagellar brake protein YcgR